jgi:hypothetical protein
VLAAEGRQAYQQAAGLGVVVLVAQDHGINPDRVH